MGKIKYKMIVVMISLNFIVLGGCGMGTFSSFDNEKEAQEYLLEQLTIKYGEDFEIIQQDEDNYEEYPTKNAYSAQLISKENPDYQFNGWTVSSGELEDNYAALFFSSQAELLAENVCEKKDYIIDYEITLEAPITSQKWNKDSDFQKYISESGAYNRIDITLEEGLSNEMYADQIFDLLNDLYECGAGFELRADNKKAPNSQLIFMFNYGYDDKKIEKPDKERIIEKIEDQEMANKSNRLSE